MADVRTWQAVEYHSVVANIKVVRGDEFIVDVQAGNNKFELGVNQLRPLAAALVKVADTIEGK
jgi:hypothetical protein